MLSAMGMYMIAMPHFIGKDLHVMTVSATSNISSSSEKTTEADLCTATRKPSCRDMTEIKDNSSLALIFIGEKSSTKAVRTNRRFMKILNV